MPQFTIEASGEAAPMTERLVFKTLEQACGSNPQLIKVATEQLSNWETQAGYYSALQDVYADFNYHQSIRFQAIIQLKNGIDKYWRKTSVNAIGKQEKIKIRTKAINVGIQEPSPGVGVQNALMLAKIVRYEFPHDWPDVITLLINHLRQLRSDTRQLTNALILALYIIKELATARLQRSRSSLIRATPEFFQVLGTLYVAHSHQWITSLRGSENDGPIVMDSGVISYWALKATRRLIIAGFEHPHRNTDVEHFWTILQSQLGEAWSIAQSQLREGEYGLSDLLTKYLTQLSKLHLEMARSHPAAFVILPGCVNLLRSYWGLIQTLGNRHIREVSVQNHKHWEVHDFGDKTDEATLLERLALKGLLLYRATVKMVFNPVHTFKYQHAEDKEERKKSLDIIKTEVLVDSFLLGMLEVLVTQFFVLRPSDLQEWDEELSEWDKHEGETADAWEFTLRSCSEKLFLDLMINYKEALIPRLLQVFYQYASPDNNEVSLKDSLYTAIGLAAAVLNSALDFNAFLASTLLPESRLSHPDYNLLRRRIPIILGQWTPVIPDTIHKPTVYQIFAHLLSSPELNDHVIRVTAGRHLRPVLEPFEFSCDEFAPYATTIFQCLMALIRDTKLIETKMALLETVRVAVERMEAHVGPFSDDIMGMLPLLWDSSGEEHMMKQAILTTITAITTSLTKQSLKYHPQILPLLHVSVQPNSEALVYLLDEALDLWSAIIQQTPSSNPFPSNELLSLSLCLLPLLELGSDSLRQTLDILESYILLSPSTILSAPILHPVLGSLSLLIGSKNTGIASARRETSRITQLLETLIKTLSVRRHFYETEMQIQAGQHLIAHALDTSFLQSLLSLLREAYDYHNDQRPSPSAPALVGPTETEVFSVLARLALFSPNLFLEAVSVASGPTTATWLVSEWISHFDDVGDVYRKKLHVLAITSLFSTSMPPPHFMLDQLQPLIAIWTDLVTELGEDAPAERKGDYLWQPGNDGPSEPPSRWAELNEAPEEGRKREVSMADPVYQTNIRDFVLVTVNSIIQGVGGPANFQADWLDRMDGAVVNAFQALQLE